jgi:FkbM family methyltransferase
MSSPKRIKSKYFLITKPHDTEILDIDNDQIVYLNADKTMIVPREYISHHSLYGIYESSLMSWIAQEFSSTDKLFLDIGAHTGTFSINLANKFKHVYAFEPQRMTYYALCGSVALSNIENITCINTALGSQEQCKTGAATLYITSEDGGSSSLHRDAAAQTQTAATTTVTTAIKEETVMIRTMDSYIDIFKNEIGVIKMDVENNELQILQGAVNTLKRSNYPMIFFECSAPHGPVFDYLQSLGYRTLPINTYANMYLAEVK